jgi:NAD(P)-dependent dehydrogenase (short-subunit alcohol dehydrogenase family)
METPLLDWLFVKKWGLAPAIPCKTKDISLLGRCLSPFFHNERTQEFMLAAVPLERFGRPDEFGALACFLASAASSYITGADLPLDGGGTA